MKNKKQIKQAEKTGIVIHILNCLSCILCLVLLPIIYLWCLVEAKAG